MTEPPDPLPREERSDATQPAQSSLCDILHRAQSPSPAKVPVATLLMVRAAVMAPPAARETPSMALAIRARASSHTASRVGWSELRCAAACVQWVCGCAGCWLGCACDKNECVCAGGERIRSWAFKRSRRHRRRGAVCRAYRRRRGGHKGVGACNSRCACKREGACGCRASYAPRGESASDA